MVRDPSPANATSDNNQTETFQRNRTTSNINRFDDNTTQTHANNYEIDLFVIEQFEAYRVSS